MSEQPLLPAEFIKCKRDGGSLSDFQIAHFIQEFSAGKIPDYQMTAWMMAVLWRGLNLQETRALTEAMLHSGEVVDLSSLAGFKVDKHSTGGVGDKTSLILGPVVAACGLSVPMISGRGLGHTGGTLDKLESIPGFNTQLSLPEFKKTLQELGLCFIGQTREICPADKKMYSLRDVTATVESLPLICASILSKKLAEGIDGLVLDVKFGSGAFMKTLESAEELARALVDLARSHGKKASALLTSMQQPLGRYAGNSLEVWECLEIMTPGQKLDRFSSETRELSLQLSAQMLALSGKDTVGSALIKATEALESGKALQKFSDMCKAQGGRLPELPARKAAFSVVSDRSGFIADMQTEALGMLCVRLGAGRRKTEDLIEPTAGLEFHQKIGDSVRAGDPLFTVFSAAKMDSVAQREFETSLKKTIVFSERAVPPVQLIKKEIS